MSAICWQSATSRRDSMIVVADRAHVTISSSSQPLGWTYTANLIAAGIACVGLPFLAYTRLILFSFYVQGSFLLDSGLFAVLLWHSDAVLTQPASAGGGSYLAVHVTPIFLPVAALSRLLPFSMPQFFAGFIGACHSLLAFAGFWMVIALGTGRSFVLPWLAALAGLGLAFSGLTVAIARYPHSEMLIPVFFLLFMTALHCRRTGLAIGLFVCGLAVREDAGLHYLAVLGLLIALDRARGVALREQRILVTFALCGLLYALAALITQHLAFPQHVSSFAQVYLGSPPLAHLSGPVIGHRLIYFVANRPYILLPAIVAGAWAWLAREPFLAIGYVACLPWLALQLLAASPFAAAVASYYAFPCLIGLAWPLVAILYRRAGMNGVARPLAIYAAMVALSYLPGHDIHDPGRLPVAAAFVHEAPPMTRQSDIDSAIAVVSAARPMLGVLLVDNSVVAIDPAGFARDEIEITPGMGNTVPTYPPQTVVFFTDGYDAARLRSIAEATGLTWRYIIRGTPLHIATRYDLGGVAGLSGMIAVER
jgi:hypothetical protein